MSTIDLESMRQYLSKSYPSLNKNKLHGLLAEIDFRRHLESIGFPSSRVSVGGWIARSTGEGAFAHTTVAMFPETIRPGQDYSVGRDLPTPSAGLHTICATFHQIGIQSYFCAPTVSAADDPTSISWNCRQLGLPYDVPYAPFPQSLSGFQRRPRRYTFLRHTTNVASVPAEAIPEEFTKEHLRISFHTHFLAEISDIDGILWGRSLTYPLEIKEKTVALDRRLGPYFGLDIGPFVKLAFYAAKRGNLHSIFVVREIDTVTNRNLVGWWFVKFEQLAQYASWTGIGGGTSMGGGRSTVVAIPRAEFQRLDLQALEAL